jgi:hypothetical protein
MRTNRTAPLVTVLLVAALAMGFLANAMAETEAPNPASPVNEAARIAAGDYEFSNAERDRRCMVNLKAEPASPTALKLDFDKTCTTIFPFAKDVVGWTIAENNFLQLVDAKGATVIEFSEVESGIFESPHPGEGVLFLQSAAAIGPPPPTPDQVAGDWNLLQGKDKVCSLALANKPNGSGDLALAVKPGCDAAIVQFGLTGWQMDEGELVMKGTEDRSWRFEENDNKTWQRIPQTHDPLTLARP